MAIHRRPLKNSWLSKRKTDKWRNAVFWGLPPSPLLLCCVLLLKESSNRTEQQTGRRGACLCLLSLNLHSIHSEKINDIFSFSFLLSAARLLHVHRGDLHPQTRGGVLHDGCVRTHPPHCGSFLALVLDQPRCQRGPSPTRYTWMSEYHRNIQLWLH